MVNMRFTRARNWISNVIDAADASQIKLRSKCVGCRNSNGRLWVLGCGECLWENTVQSSSLSWKTLLGVSHFRYPPIDYGIAIDHRRILARFLIYNFGKNIFRHCSQSNHHGSNTISCTQRAPETPRSTGKRNSTSISPTSKKHDSNSDMKRFQKSAAIYTLPMRQNKRTEKPKGKSNLDIQETNRLFPRQ